MSNLKGLTKAVGTVTLLEGSIKFSNETFLTPEIKAPKEDTL